ncbi:MAG: gamma-butyrobetaine hydroxylase-like domain-containing protein [Roseiarcus sp.]|jgi:DUF971 family protein
MGEEPADPWPSELRVREAGRVLRITFADGFTADISAERLRAASPSADKRRPPAPEGGVRIVGVDTVGNYAARIAFSDGHNSGIYSWRLLRALAADQAPPPGA